MRLLMLLLLLPISALAQTTPYMYGLLRLGNPTAAKQYLQINTFVAGSNIVFTPMPGTTTIVISSTVTGGGGGGTNAPTIITGDGGITVTSNANQNFVIHGPSTNTLATIDYVNTVSNVLRAFTVAATNDLNSAFTSALNSCSNVLRTLTINATNSLYTTFTTDINSASNALRQLTVDATNGLYVITTSDLNSASNVLRNFAISTTNVTFSPTQVGRLTNHLDVLSGALANQDVLAYDSSQGKWTNGPPSFSSTTNIFASVTLDYPMTNVTAGFDSTKTNFILDFAWPAQRWITSNNIALRYSTNWPSNTDTSRFIQIFIPPTNTLRNIAIYDQSTNWMVAGLSANTILPGGQGAILRANIFAQGETNVTLTYAPNASQLSQGESFFSPPSVSGLILWLDASQTLYSDVTATNLVLTNNAPVRRWDDMSGNGNYFTNQNSVMTWLSTGGPNSRPCVHFTGAANSWLRSITQNAYSQPLWVFIVLKRSAAATGYYWIDGKASVNTMAVDVTSGNAHVWSAGTAQTFRSDAVVAFFQGSFFFSGASSIARTNGIQAAALNVNTGGPTGFVIGATPTATSILAGDISEVLVYNASLSGVNITNVERYIAAKYALPGP